ncbi:MAG: hypothetical protein AAF747_04760 [Planctomycetota bacterium]
MNNRLIAVSLIAAASAASAQVDSFFVNERVFNDNSASSLSITGASGAVNGANITIEEQFFTGNSGANRHDILLSDDGGASARVFPSNRAFRLSADVNLAVTVNAPRKEAGIRINSNVTNDTLFIINSDAGEIVSFGGGAAFNSFGNNGGGNGYTPGTTITMGIEYRPGVGGNPATLEYFIDRGAGLETSGPLAYGNNEGQPVDFNVGFYGQFQYPGGGFETNTATFSNVSFIPTPASAALLAMGGLAASRRRR